MNNSPLVSIITVCYNAASTISRTIESVLDQTYDNIEYIIVDGMSTDSTLDVINKYNSKISLVITERDNGIYDAMNKGILASKGELIGIINADDWYEKNAVEVIVGSWMDNPSVSVFHGLLRFWDLNCFLFVRGHSHQYLPTSMIEHPTCFITRQTYKSVGFYSVHFKAAADYDLILRIYKAGHNFIFIDKIIANFSLGGITSTKISLLEELVIKRSYKLISRSKYWVKCMLVHLRAILV